MAGPQESIKASRDWFLACAPHAGGMAARMAQALAAQPAHDRQLHLIYLANDILLTRRAARRRGLARRDRPREQRRRAVLVGRPGCTSLPPGLL
jgi:hypothetical protein